LDITGIFVGCLKNEMLSRMGVLFFKTPLNQKRTKLHSKTWSMSFMSRATASARGIIRIRAHA
jgi:hypothetical protein